MKKLRLLFNSEPKVEDILRRGFTEPEYRVYPKVRLGDVIGKEEGEHLPERVFRYLTAAHLDFLVVKEGVSLFGVEFDGAHHFTDPATIERDTLKNWICCAAELPLLRITASEIVERDKLTLLDYMISLIVAWSKELPSIMSEIQSFSDALPEGYDEQDLAADLDPMFRFGLRHPYPLVPVLQQELRRSYKMIDEFDPTRSEGSHHFLYEVAHLGGPHPRHLDLRESVAQLTLWRSSPEGRAQLLRVTESVTMRWALSLGDRPPPNLSESAAKAIQPLLDQLSAAGVPVRVNFPWMPKLPGIDPHDIGDTYAEYLALRKLKIWARDHVATAMTEEHLRRRAERASAQRLDAVLAKLPDADPAAEDAIPEGYLENAPQGGKRRQRKKEAG